MKYCRKCGMLLEDTTTTCIRCGADVEKDENTSVFPKEVEDTINAQIEEGKNRAGLVALIICILVVLVGAIVIAALAINRGGFTIQGSDADITSNGFDMSSAYDADADLDMQAQEDADEYTEDATEEYEDAERAEAFTDNTDEAAEAESSADDEGVMEGGNADTEDTDEETAAGREVNDAVGDYYDIGIEKDDAGNVILEAVYPEDFDTVDFSVDYEKYSETFPVEMKFIAGGEDGAVQFLYMSPMQLWYKDSKSGNSLSDNKLPNTYMTFYKYDGPKGYIEAMLKESYPDAKIELVNEEEISSEATVAIRELAESRKNYILDQIKKNDYAHIGEDTSYALMGDGEYSANIYEYEITTSDKQMIFDKFYVPMLADVLDYANSDSDDMGSVTEWYYFAFIVMEAGNEDLYYDYADAFDVFTANCCPTDTFFSISQQFGGEVKELVNAGRAIEPLTEEKLKEYGKKNTELSDFNRGVKKVLTAGNTCFENDELSLYAPSGTKAAFIDADTGKLFISTDASAYPGDEYEELTAVEE